MRPVFVRPHLALLAWAGLTLAAASPAHALSEWGTNALGNARVCPGGLCSGTFLQRDEVDAPQQDFASVEIEAGVLALHPDIFFAAEAGLTGALGEPLLRAVATADTTTRYSVSTAATATQGYRYEGAAPKEFTIDAALSGTVAGNGTLSAQLNVYDVAGFDPLQPFLTRITGTSGFLSTTRDDPLAELTFTLDPGQEIYVIAQLNAGADSRFSTPSNADAFSTLTTSFRDGAGLALAVDVPEPSLLVLGGAAVFALARRRARRT